MLGEKKNTSKFYKEESDGEQVAHFGAAANRKKRSREPSNNYKLSNNNESPTQNEILFTFENDDNLTPLNANFEQNQDFSIKVADVKLEAMEKQKKSKLKVDTNFIYDESVNSSFHHAGSSVHEKP